MKTGCVASGDGLSDATQPVLLYGEPVNMVLQI